VLEIHADKIHILPADPGLERLIVFRFVWLGCCQRFEVVPTTDGLIGKCFRLFCFEELARLDAVRLTFFCILTILNSEAVILGAMVPVQNLRLAGGIPLDQRTPFSTRLEG
jgi:hypothetical protein